jgi:hypothetical protein
MGSTVVLETITDVEMLLSLLLCSPCVQVPQQYPPEVLEAFTSRGKVEWGSMKP